MHAKAFTFGVVVATVIGAVNLVSHQIDKQQAESGLRPIALQPVIRAQASSLSTASPMDIDPRRMAAPVDEGRVADDAGSMRNVVLSSSN